MRIQTQYIRPPIASRRFDWSAIDSDTYDGAPDSPTRNQVGYGTTEREAIEELKAQLETKSCPDIHAITDRKHIAWDAAHAALKKAEVE